MNTEGLDRTIAWMKQLWPGWDPNEAQLVEWEFGFRHATEAAACEAVRSHFRGSRWKAPDPKPIFEKLAMLLEGGAEAVEPSHDGYSGYWVICVAHEVCPGRIGMFTTQCYPRTEPLPEHHVLHGHFEALAKLMGEEVYGGDWQVVCNLGGFVSHEEMWVMRNELRERRGPLPGAGRPRQRGPLAQTLEELRRRGQQSGGPQ